MRVAMLGPYPWDENQIVGGVEAVIICLLKHLSRMPELELHVVTCQPGVPDHGTVQEKTGWIVHRLPRKGLGRLTFHLRERRRIGALLHKLKPDVVHAHTSGLYAAAALDAGYPTVITAHGISFREAEIFRSLGERLRGLLDGAFERRCLRRAKYFVSISPYVEQEFAGVLRARTFAIENPVEDLFFSVAEEPLPYRILFVGRLIPRKGVQYLLSAFREIAIEFPQAELRLAGDEEGNQPYAIELHEYVRREKLERRVHFLGSLSMDEVAAEYGKSALVVLPSKQETAPVVIEEAMAVGRPVIATRVGGTPYLVDHERTGLLVEYGDVEALAASMRRLLSDQSLRAQMGQAAKSEAVRRFRGDLIAEQTRQMYRQIVEESKIGK